MGTSPFILSNFRMYERKDIDHLTPDETETSSIMRIKKEDLDKKPNSAANLSTEKPDTVLYLREINKYPPLSILTNVDAWR
jgi:hypothetical protein